MHEVCVSQSETNDYLMSASVGGSPAEVGWDCGSPWGQGHWQQKFWEVLLGVSPPRVCHYFLLFEKDVIMVFFQFPMLDAQLINMKSLLMCSP